MRTAASRSSRSHVPRDQSNRSRLQGTRSALSLNAQRLGPAACTFVVRARKGRRARWIQHTLSNNSVLIHGGYERPMDATPGFCGKQTVFVQTPPGPAGGAVGRTPHLWSWPEICNGPISRRRGAGVGQRFWRLGGTGWPGGRRCRAPSRVYFQGGRGPGGCMCVRELDARPGSAGAGCAVSAPAADPCGDFRPPLPAPGTRTRRALSRRTVSNAGFPQWSYGRRGSRARSRAPGRDTAPPRRTPCTPAPCWPCRP